MGLPFMCTRYYSNNPLGKMNIPSRKFMAMFMGFMDGDGYFDIGEQK